MPDPNYLAPGPFYEDAQGRPQDASLHAMLDNEEANSLMELAVIEDEVEDGMPIEEACRHYASPHTLEILAAEGRIVIDRAPK